jgi:hypothetical protein
VSSGANFFLKKTLGEDFFESLTKVELWKMGTKTTTDHEEIKTALQIVPRTIMSFLINNLQSMLVGETKELTIPIEGSSPVLRVTKHERDVFSGEIEDSTEKYTDKKVAEFKFRSIPGIGLVIMSTFELYNVDDLDKKPQHEAPITEMVQKMIDERLALHDLIGKVVDKKITERDAIQSLVLAKLSNSTSMENRMARMKDRLSDKPTHETNIKVNVDVSPEISVKNKVKIKKVSPLKDFLEDRSKKLKKNEFKIELMKGEQISCPDCGQNVFNGDVFGACICYGDCGKVFLKKSEDGFTVRFSKNWDAENIMMFLDVMRRHRG